MVELTNAMEEGINQISKTDLEGFIRNSEGFMTNCLNRERIEF